VILTSLCLRYLLMLRAIAMGGQVLALIADRGSLMGTISTTGAGTRHSPAA